MYGLGLKLGAFAPLVALLPFAFGIFDTPLFGAPIFLALKKKSGRGSPLPAPHFVDAAR